MALVTPEQIRAHLPSWNISDDQAASAVRLVGGWLLDATGLDVLPDVDPLSTDPDPLWSDALELCVLAVTNPELLASKTVGPTSRTWPAARERDSILERVRLRYFGPKAAAGDGFGCFPDPTCWPDPPTILPPGPVYGS